MRPAYRAEGPPSAKICWAIRKGAVVGFGPAVLDEVLLELSWMRTLTTSTGWMTVVATIPEEPPMMKGRMFLISGCCNMLELLVGELDRCLARFAGVEDRSSPLSVDGIFEPIG